MLIYISSINNVKYILIYINLSSNSSDPYLISKLIGNLPFAASLFVIVDEINNLDA